MFYLYQKDGAWKIRGVEGFFNFKEEAFQIAINIGSSQGLQEFDIMVEEPEPVEPSPYENILGFTICHRCFLHPCEC